VILYHAACRKLKSLSQKNTEETRRFISDTLTGDVTVHRRYHLAW
jgi:hypothetical protein